MAVTTGNLTSANSSLVIQTDGPTIPSPGSVGVKIIGNWTGTINFQFTIDGQNFDPASAVPIAFASTFTGVVASTTANGVWSIPIYGYTQVRIFGQITAGTATVSTNVTAQNIAIPPPLIQVVNALIDIDTQMRNCAYSLAQINSNGDVPPNLADPTKAVTP
jgi:hypothetical protein